MPFPSDREVTPLPVRPAALDGCKSWTPLLWLASLSLSASLLSPAHAAPKLRADTSAKIEFNRDIRPILSDNCFSCHGPDKAQRKAKLRLDDRAVALEMGALLPGKPAESELIKRILSQDPEEMMPPPDSHKTLSPAQKEKLQRWIAQGANYQPHWAYLKPVRAQIPSTRNQRWVHNPVDAFILHSLETRGFKPSPAAEKRLLLRRLSLDLTGLPPTPAEVEAFLLDRDPKAYEKQVERLLASPHFGERMAVPWLDVVRFSDTVGYHGDQNQRIFPYRDYVINSFNNNKPFDQFTIEQLAGDLLPNPTVEQQVATGFNRLNMMTREGGAQDKEYLAKYAADRVRTVSTAWLGSTMACCECHDHKFDPFSAKDFYQFSAYFADIRQWGVYADYDYTPKTELKNFGNDHPFPPEVQVESPYLQRRDQHLRREMAKLHALSTSLLQANPVQQQSLAQWKGEMEEFLAKTPSGWILPEPALVPPKTTNTPAITNVIIQADQSILFTSKAPDATEIRLLPPPGWISALRLELLPSTNQEGAVFRKGAKGTLRLSALKKAGTNETKLSFYHAEADLKETRYSGTAEIVGMKDEWAPNKAQAKSPQTAVYLLDKPARFAQGDELVLTLKGDSLSCVRLALSPLAQGDPLLSGASEPIRSALASDLLSAGESLAQLYFLSTGWENNLFGQYKKLSREILGLHEGKTYSQVTVATNPVPVRVLPRGNWQDETGELVEPAPPHFLPQLPRSPGQRANRLDLARWMVSPDNPLTARTAVNRFWKQFFGTGLCSTLDDLGSQGDRPVHPDLLDWLAVEFQENHWDVKHMVRLMVLSSTYRQHSNARPNLREKDPDNRLLASQSPRRLEAEFVRDNALFIAGLLNQDLGGPSAHPYQPANYYVNLQFPDRDYIADRDEHQYRRGVYSHWQRTFLHPMLANFDAPSREECVANRNVSNTPQQALTLLNDPTFVEAARHLAQSLVAGASQDEERIDLVFRKALTRPALRREKKSLRKFLATQRDFYQAHPEDAAKLVKVGLAPAPAGPTAELAAWTSLCRVVLNLHESITLY